MTPRRSSPRNSPKPSAKPNRSPWPTLPPRTRDAHKRSAGAVVVIGGAPTMPGAPTFVALGALRTGCGYVRLAVPAAIRAACLQLVPSAIAQVTDVAGHWLRTIDDTAVIAFGPGMPADTTSTAARKLLSAIIKRALPIVIDGGGLHALAAIGTKNLHPGQAILTPHPGEYARLADVFHLPACGTTTATRTRAAKSLADICRGTVVLKGPETIITDGAHVLRDTIGGPELAIPGSGDVLTGIISALRAHGLPPFAAAALGVRLHSLAGRICSQRGICEGLLATELAALVPAAIAEHRRAAY